ncbi:hypothetical protein [Neotabrizicola sp. sgz301269]|uniref:hypothetical protein n=1 Tax=Neotabrizicola sp. sgz301269 TaxID=3276282 RepID=UPI00376F7F58
MARKHEFLTALILLFEKAEAEGSRELQRLLLPVIAAISPEAAEARRLDKPAQSPRQHHIAKVIRLEDHRQRPDDPSKD